MLKKIALVGTFALASVVSFSSSASSATDVASKTKASVEAPAPKGMCSVPGICWR